MCAVVPFSKPINPQIAGDNRRTSLSRSPSLSSSWSKPKQIVSGRVSGVKTCAKSHMRNYPPQISFKTELLYCVSALYAKFMQNASWTMEGNQIYVLLIRKVFNWSDWSFVLCTTKGFIIESLKTCNILISEAAWSFSIDARLHMSASRWITQLMFETDSQTCQHQCHVDYRWPQQIQGRFIGLWSSMHINETVQFISEAQTHVP